MYPILFIVNIQCKQQMTFQVGGKLMPRITCRVGDVPRTCCETQSSPESSPRSPLFLGRPGGRGGHDGTPIVLWITWPDSIFLDGRSLPDSLVLHLGNLGDHLGLT